MDNRYIEIIVDNSDGGISKYLTFSKIDIFNNGLVSEAIIGINKDRHPINNKINPDDFVENTIFKKVMHKVIEEETLNLLSFQKEVKKQKDGWIYVVDRRDINNDLNANNIIGSFKIKNSKVIEYRINKNHKLLTVKGFFLLDEEIEKKLINVLESYYK